MQANHYSNFTMGSILERAAQFHGDKVFLKNLSDGRTFSFVELDRLSTRVANGFLDAGISKGSHVAMLMENSPEQVLTYFALGKIGAVVVPINTAARSQFLAYYLEQSDSTALVIDRSMLSVFSEIADGAGIDTIFVGGEGSPQSDAKDVDDPRMVSFQSLLSGSEAPVPTRPIFSDPASIMYTSGTTGPSKGNVFSQIHALTFGMGLIEPHELTHDDCCYIFIPLFHVAGFNSALMNMLLVGGSVALTKRFSVSRFWDDVAQAEATWTILVSMGSFLLKAPPSPRDRENSLRMALSGPMMAEHAEFEDRFNLRLTQTYGLSDFGLPFGQSLNEPDDKRMSIGRLLKGCSARIVGDNDEELPLGELGEIVLRKDDMPFAATQCYYNMPEATVRARRNLWFHTGDRGYRDADGYFYYVDRKSDSIRRRGENISAFEVEAAIASHPAVLEVAVYGVPASSGEDDVAASVVFSPGEEITEAELIAHCQQSLPYFMIPRYLDVRDKLPRTSTEKIRKNELRDYLKQNTHVVFDCERAGIRITRYDVGTGR